MGSGEHEAQAGVRKEDLKEEERMRMKREMVEKRTHESFDIVTHLEKRGMSSCAAFAKEKTTTTTTREVARLKRAARKILMTLLASDDFCEEERK